MIIAILLLGLFLRVLNLNQSYWLDEAAQMIESIRPFIQQFDIQADFWPPLYHVLLHFWVQFGTSEIWTRSLSVGLGLVSIYMTYVWMKQYAYEKTALLAAFLVSISPFHIWYSQEVRPYMLTVVLAMLSIHFLYRKNAVGYIIFTALFLYSTYLAPFFMLTQGIYVFVFQKKYWHAWFKQILIAIVPFLVWLPKLWQQLTGGVQLTHVLPGWSEAVSTPLSKALPLTFIKFIIGRVTFDNKLVYAGVFFICVVLVIVVIRQGLKKERKNTKELLLLFGVPIGLSFLVSFIVPIFAPQRMLFVLPFFYALISVGVIALTAKWRFILVGFFISISLYSLILYTTNPRFQREQWREAVSYVENNSTSHSLVLFAFPDAFAPWQWYTQEKVFALGIAPDFQVNEVSMSAYHTAYLSTDRIFYFHYLSDLTDPQKTTQNYLERLGFAHTETIDFPGVGFVYIYEKFLAHN